MKTNSKTIQETVETAEEISARIMADYEFYKNIPGGEAIIEAMICKVGEFDKFINDAKRRIVATKGEAL